MAKSESKGVIGRVEGSAGSIEKVAVNAIVHSQAMAEIDSLVATAKMYPRRVDEFADKLLAMVGNNIEIAESCIYSVPRAGKDIRGPSVRFAELALNCWGNIIAEASVIGEDDRYTYASGWCRDLENNIAIKLTKKRRITNSQGIRFNDDMIAVTANAAVAIALRDSILKIIPRVLYMPAYDEVRQVAIGKADKFSSRRIAVFEKLNKLGVDNERIFAALSAEYKETLSKITDITPEHLEYLIGLGTAIKEGDKNLDDVFPPVQGVGQTELSDNNPENEKTENPQIPAGGKSGAKSGKKSNLFGGG